MDKTASLPEVKPTRSQSQSAVASRSNSRPTTRPSSPDSMTKHKVQSLTIVIKLGRLRVVRAEPKAHPRLWRPTHRILHACSC